MKKKTIYKILCSCVILLVYACTQDISLSEGEGILKLGVRVDDAIKMVPIQLGRSTTRGALTKASLEESCKIYIRNSKGLIRKYEGMSNVPSELHLTSDSYKVIVTAGDSVNASFDTPYYKGSETFTVKGGQSTEVNVTCCLANTLVSVTYDNNIATLLDPESCVVTVWSSVGELAFDFSKQDNAGYFMMPTGETELQYKLTAKDINNNLFEYTGTITDVKPCYKYKLTFANNGEDYQEGGAFIKITIDESRIEVNEDVYIRQRPDIIGYEFDITQPIYQEIGEGIARTVFINTTSELKSAMLSSEQFAQLNIIPSSFDFMAMSEGEKANLENLGISYEYIYNAEKEESLLKVKFAESLMQPLPEGEYIFTFSATDIAEKSRTQDFKLIVSNATVLTEEINPVTVWTNRARLEGKKIKATQAELGFRYRKSGTTDEWTTAPAIESGDTFYADITDLTPNTTYEVVATDGQQASSVTKTFTTENITQLPNNSFENWHQSGKTWLIYGENESIFWDSGNHGSSTLGVNVTNYDESTQVNGNRSIKLSSQFVGILGIGKFAAGNLFAGEYVGTDGTDGILDFGRPFTDRPATLTGYYKYNQGTIDYVGSGTPEGITSGTPDIGCIYIAIGDWDTPVRIKTKDKTLFDPNDEHIIAYGELNLTQGQTDWKDFSIKLEYRSKERKPKYIIVVASASKYGDYFTGSTTSTLWLDDFNLSYE